MKALASVFIFFLSLVCTAALIARVIPPAEVPQFSEKLEYFAAHKDEFATLFIGSRRTFRLLLPTVFDPAMTAGGQPTRSFNFGLDGMFSPEDSYVAGKIFALPPAKP